MSCNYVYVFNGGKERYKQLSKRMARKVFNDGTPVYLLPNKVSSECLRSDFKGFVSPCVVRYDKKEPLTNAFGEQFDKVLAYFEQYNCNAELGRYAHYYIRLD